MIRPALVAMALPVAAMAQVEGTYSLDCAAGTMSDGRVTVGKGTISFHESTCTLTDPVAVRGMTDAVLYDATCTGEGESWTRRILLMPASDGGLVRVEDGYAVTYARCEGP